MEDRFIPILARFFAELSLEDLGDALRERAKVCVLDAIASAYASHQTEPVRIMTDITGRFVTPGEQATVWVKGYKTNYLFATLANSMLVHNMIIDDMNQSTRGHAGNLIVPTVLALAEARDRPCRDILPAVVIGYEAMGRLASPAVAHSVARGFRGTSTYGPFGVAAAMGKILGLGAEQIGHAISCAAGFALGGLFESFNVGSMEWRFQNSLAILAGALAALSAKEGMKAARSAFEGQAGFVSVFCGREVKEKVIAAWMKESATLGQDYDISRTFFKPYSTCGYNQIGCNIALNLIEKHNLTPEMIAEVVVRVSPDNKDYPGVEYPGPFETPDWALVSKAFALAAVVVTRDLQIETYQNRLNDPEILRIAKMVRLEADESMNSMDTEIKFITRDGRTFKGDLSTANLAAFILNRDSAVKKFHHLADAFIGSRRVDEIAGLVFNLEELKSITELTSRLTLAAN